jgi:hypothetical protein
MATTTFQGRPKPSGKPGHYYEPMRHSLQAKGIKTGNISGSSIYGSMGIQNLEKPTLRVDETPKTSTGLEDIQQETINEKEEQPKKVPFTEKVKAFEEKLGESLRRERELKARLRKERLYKELGKKEPEPIAEPETDEDEETDEEEYDSESLPAKLGKFMADLDEDYTPEDLVGLNDKELEMLAVRHKSEMKESVFSLGEGSNPFLDELKRRIEARDELKKEKAKIREELKHPKEKDIWTDWLGD